MISVFPPKYPFKPAENARSLCSNTFPRHGTILNVTKVRYGLRDIMLTPCIKTY